MIANYEDVYEPFLRGVISRVGIMRKRQLLNCLLNCFLDVSRSQAESVLTAFQRRGYAIYSEDGYAFTKGAFRTITGAVYLDSDGIKDKSRSLITDENGHAMPFNRNNYEHFMECRMDGFMKGRVPERQWSMIDSMWIVSDMMPDAMNFMVAEYPWVFAFVSEATEEIPGRLFEVARIPREGGLLHLEGMKLLPKIESGRMRESLRRIAILEDESLVDDVPYIGFTHICVIDESEDSGYRVLERRKGIGAYEAGKN